jgi:heparosan-N-sulfate-glucuronate 5-epimerase
LGRYNESILSYDRAIELNPQFAGAWNNKGDALGVLGRHEEAIKAFRNTIKINSQYTDTLDDKGVPIVDYGYYPPKEGISYIEKTGYTYVGKHYNAVRTAQTGLGYYAQYESGNQSAGKLFLNCADWLVENAIVKGNYSVWEYDFTPVTYRNITPPFVSGMAQGLGIKVLAIASTMTGDKKYLSAANQALNAFFVDVDKGGVTYKDQDGWWYEEYAQKNNKQQPRVLNGFIITLDGIKNYYDLTKDERAKYLYDVGFKDLKAHVADFDTGNWTNYDMVGTKATLSYHQIHVQLMDEVYRTTGDPEFKMYRDKWVNYDIAKLTQINYLIARITSDRDELDKGIAQVEAIQELPTTEATEKPVHRSSQVLKV